MIKVSNSEQKQGKIRTRIAPSPTGLFHIGNARTALFNYLFTKKNNGTLILRVEDTDQERSKKEYEEDIIESLKWLDIQYDELYRQSERTEIYKKYIEKFLEEDKAYYCFCPPDELESQRQYQISQGQSPKYSGKCLGMPKQEIEKNLEANKPFVVRFKVPIKKTIFFHDLIRSKIKFDSSQIGDFIISKGLDQPLYNFVVVVDDYEMKISHIIRGEDHISNTPKQILIQKAMGFPQLKYAHIPLILGTDRSKLSKRHGATSISEYRKLGYLPETIVNFMAFLGWNPDTEREIYTMPSLIKEFSLEGIQKGGAVFNIKKLDNLNGFYIRQKSLKRLTELCMPYLVEAGLIDKTNHDLDYSETPGLFKQKKSKIKIKETKELVDIDYIKNIIQIYQERLKFLSEIVELTSFFFKDKLDYENDLLRWKSMSNQEIKQALDKVGDILRNIDEKKFNKNNLEKIFLTEANGAGDRGSILWPLRVALTGQKASASPFEIAEILGKEKTLKRVVEAEGKL